MTLKEKGYSLTNLSDWPRLSRFTFALCITFGSQSAEAMSISRHGLMCGVAGITDATTPHPGAVGNFIRHVFGGGAPVQIVEVVIAGVAVKVAALFAGSLGADKGFEHQAVDRPGVVAVLLVAKGDDLVAASV